MNISESTRDAIRADREPGPDGKPKLSYPQIAQKYGIALATAWRIDHRMDLVPKKPKPQPEDKPPEEQTTVELGSNTGVITTISPKIRTLDEALAHAAVDMSVWQVDRHLINYWPVTMRVEGKPVQVTNYQIKIWLKRIIVSTIDVALREVTARLETYRPKPLAPIRKATGPYLLELCLFDHHFGMLAWDKETGTDYDVKIAEQIYRDAVIELLGKVQGCKISRILLPFGNDFFHTNDPLNQTPKNKNRLDVDGRLAKIFAAGKMAVIEGIEACKQIAPVDIVWAPGNHDPQMSWFLSEVLAAYYRHDKSVSVDNSPKSRKCYAWGTSLIGFTHGDEEPEKELPRIFADEFPQLWAAAHFKEIHRGHQHRVKEMNFISADTFGSTTVRMIPSLCGTDAWHYSKGYGGRVRAAQGFLWHETDGVDGPFNAHVR
jgi:hypothetical protein